MHFDLINFVCRKVPHPGGGVSGVVLPGERVAALHRQVRDGGGPEGVRRAQGRQLQPGDRRQEQGLRRQQGQDEARLRVRLVSCLIHLLMSCVNSSRSGISNPPRHEA